MVNRLVLHRQTGDDFDDTLAIVRHEASHQFFFTYGVHSQHRVENEWLIEGLACYCEASIFGARDKTQLAILQEGRKFEDRVNLSQLVNHHSTRGLLGYKATEVAYGESWALIHFLMQPERRHHFFSYIRHLRNPANFRQTQCVERIDLLAEFLNMTPAELETESKRYLATLQQP